MSTMMALVKQDIKFQVRHGFYLAYAVITMMYIASLSFLPEQAKPLAASLIIFSDPSALGYFFIGGIILLEKGQNIFDNLFVTPVQIRDYIMSKVLSLGLISLITSVIIHGTVFGFAHLTFLFISGVLLTSVLFTLIGMAVAVRCQSLNGFFLLSPLYSVWFCLPLLGFLNIYDSPLYYVLPTQASLLLISSPFSPLEKSLILLLFFTLFSWIGLAYMWAFRSFRHHIVFKMGGSMV
ncbi:fluoroquinolone transport system permease protein [Caldalkalibacillus uzonensis]|uniref:Fluoroquinolone transport system permease protein n=1 Tax=Caldalkalibacillus uzonensis TaxID=353224 RepID=A0ABU0CNP2_9BACI|nr:hypothetical protein [Caldalkalibacillus uzonensis]MDQ0338024.1 fluoroquinolone transport system permease protein [Caldalkalibacillus uzonensis]